MFTRRNRRFNRYAPLISASRHDTALIFNKSGTRSLARNRLTINNNSSSTQLDSSHATNNNRRRINQNRRSRNISILLIRNITRIIRINLHTRNLISRRRTRRRAILTNRKFSKKSKKGQTRRFRTSNSRPCNTQATKDRYTHKIKKTMTRLIGNNLSSHANNIKGIQQIVSRAKSNLITSSNRLNRFRRKQAFT